jgi:hypothetical protein
MDNYNWAAFKPADENSLVSIEFTNLSHVTHYKQAFQILCEMDDQATFKGAPPKSKFLLPFNTNTLFFVPEIQTVLDSDNDLARQRFISNSPLFQTSRYGHFQITFPYQYFLDSLIAPKFYFGNTESFSKEQAHRAVVTPNSNPIAVFNNIYHPLQDSVNTLFYPSQHVFKSSVSTYGAWDHFEIVVAADGYFRVPINLVGIKLHRHEESFVCVPQKYDGYRTPDMKIQCRKLWYDQGNNDKAHRMTLERAIFSLVVLLQENNKKIPRACFIDDWDFVIAVINDCYGENAPHVLDTYFP